MDNNYLQHYGVVGMKWGIRRGKAAQAYHKGVKKLKKTEKKASNYKYKSDKKASKSAKLYYKGTNDDKARKLDRESRKLAFKSTKLLRKGKKFYKKMEKTFKDVPIKTLNKEDVEYGKRYANSVLF